MSLRTPLGQEQKMNEMEATIGELECKAEVLVESLAESRESLQEQEEDTCSLIESMRARYETLVMSKVRHSA